MRITRRSLVTGVSSALALVIVVVLVLVLTGNSAAVRPKPKPTPKHTERPVARGPLTSPFTGERIKSLRRELIFKIDNIVYARPPTGLTKADLIYILPVDAGLSRIMAVFSSHVPPIVGPVRSSREEDIKLLRQFGRPAFAFSGAQPALLSHVEHARIVDLYAGRVNGYFRNYNRIAPYNLFADTKTLLREAPHASLARDIGFRFGSAPPGGKPTSSYHVTYPLAQFTFRWSKSQQRYLCWMDGSPAYATEGGQLGARTIVIQYVRVSKSVFRELGQKPPYANTVGSGRAVVLRGGRAYQVHWSRPVANHGTAFTLPDGKRMPFAVGQVWVVYAYGPGSSW